MRRQMIIGPDTKLTHVGGRPTRAVLALLIIQIGLFVAWAFADAPAWVALHLAASAEQTLHKHELWQPLSAFWLHLGARDIFFNSLVLWIFGSALERWWGSRRFVVFWIVTGTIGIAVGVVAGLLQPQTLLTGSAGAATATMVAFAFLFPEHLVFFYGVLPLKAKHLALVLIGFTLVGSLLGRSFLELPVQLGGAAAALLFVMRPRRKRVTQQTRAEDARRKLHVIQGGKHDEKRYWN